MYLLNHPMHPSLLQWHLWGIWHLWSIRLRIGCSLQQAEHLLHSSLVTLYEFPESLIPAAHNLISGVYITVYWLSSLQRYSQLSSDFRIPYTLAAMNPINTVLMLIAQSSYIRTFTCDTLAGDCIYNKMMTQPTSTQCKLLFTFRLIIPKQL